MNRTGLAIVLAVAVLAGGLFGVFPRLDVGFSALFFESARQKFILDHKGWVDVVRAAARVTIGLLVAPAVIALIGKVILPGRSMLIGGRTALFLTVTLALGPGILANTVLKDHWGRYRPSDVTAFGGPDPFMPWWDPRGQCVDNCSFVAGEPSGAFWTVAPAALTPPQWRPAAYGAAVAFGAAIGLLRIAGGGHFFTDVVFAGVLMFLVVWTTHGLLYRWRSTRITDKAVERAFERIGKAIRDGFARIARHDDAST